ncbi:MAG: DUF1549 domain-containing protein [Aureliella sp.]
MQMLKRLLLVAFSIATFAAGPRDSIADDKISYQRDVEPIFRARCQGCHQGAKKGGDYLMTSYSALMAIGESGQAAIVPGKPEESYLVELVTPADGVAAMPQEGKPLSEQEIATICNWISQGAADDSAKAGPKFSPDNLPTYQRAPLTTSISSSPDGKWIAVTGFHEVIVLDAKTLQPASRLVGLSPRIESVAFSPDSTRVAVTGGSPGVFGEVQVWDVAAGELLLSKQISFDTIASGAWSPDGKMIAIGCSDNTLRAIDAETGEQLLHQGAHEDWIRACVFTPDGKHLLSAARDMTVKLTEVQTQRFVDNVTSITPGALRGGVNSLSMHPERSELLVGGADGTPKVYRVFRETQRRIGDDANLVRQFPMMKGRIFATAISPDGKSLAAASTLDGKSQVVVYPYNFNAELPEDVKAVMAKRVSDRKPDEKKLVEDYILDVPKPKFDITIDATSIYAVAFTADSKSLVAGGADGIIRQFSAAGELEREVIPVETVNEQLAGSETAENFQVADGLAGQIDGLTSEKRSSGKSIEPSDVVALRVLPSQITLSGANDYAQIVVMAELEDGSEVDVTRLSTLIADDGVAVSDRGLLRANTSKPERRAAELTVKFHGHQTQIPCTLSGGSLDGQVDFITDVNPILSRLGCNSGTCHGAQKGKNGFKLSLRGYDPVEDIRALSDDLVSRRLNAAAPDASLMLLKPLGAVPHEGGVLLSRDSVYYSVLQRWIAGGARLEPTTAKVASIEIFPKNPVIDREGAWQQFRIVATFPDGSQRDVTREAFIESGNSEVVVSHATGLVNALRRGEAPILARYEGAYAATTVTVMGDRSGFAWQQPKANSEVDRLVAAKWQRMKILPSGLCTDSEFLRRVHLDLTGLPPTPEELRAFLDDTAPSKEKRSAKIDQLIGSAEFIDHWTNKWADLLQVNSKFLGKAGAQSLRGWIHEAIAENRPYDEFVHQILTATGSNKDNPAASYFKILRDPDLMMENTTHLFLAVRFNCNKCHDHPFERWTQDQYYELAAFFSQTELKPDPASKGKKIGGTAVEGAKPLYELVADSNAGEMKHVRTGDVVAPAFPYECEHEVDADATRREKLAAWMTSPDNQYFARSYVNRLWGYLTGTGLMEPLDDIRAGNPPTNPALLEHLTKKFIDGGFDTEAVLREICNSRTYQLSVASNRWNVDDSINYSHAKARRLPAEVLYDAVYQVTGAVSKIPGVAPGTRAAALPDVAFGLEDGFLNNLGRPVRESACECERSDGLQLGPIMALVSGPTVGSAISDPDCALPILVDQKDSTEALIREIYMRVLSREATSEEVQAIVESERQIEVDHERLNKQLARREAWWKDQRTVLEAKRLERLAATNKAIADRTAAIADQRAKDDAKRLDELKAAEAALAEYEAKAIGVANKYLSKRSEASNWYPLAARALKSSNKAQLRALPDRSIVATGDGGKGSYTLQFDTTLSQIGSIRLEALTDDSIKGGGPGLPTNGNFVITELEVFIASKDAPDEKTPIRLTNATADFSQAGFDPKQAIDGNKGNQKGWAVSPRGGTVHWASFSADNPIAIDGSATITVVLHQNHNAGDHRLGRFRISASKSAGEIGPGLPEEFAALLAVEEKDRKAETLGSLLAYLKKSDAPWQKLKRTVASKKKPLPEDAQLVKLRAEAQALSEETKDDAKLLVLRSDVAASQNQLKNKRLTLAQDLTWALINSPAFLFNR